MTREKILPVLVVNGPSKKYPRNIRVLLYLSEHIQFANQITWRMRVRGDLYSLISRNKEVSPHTLSMKEKVRVHLYGSIHIIDNLGPGLYVIPIPSYFYIGAGGGS